MTTFYHCYEFCLFCSNINCTIYIFFYFSLLRQLLMCRKFLKTTKMIFITVQTFTLWNSLKNPKCLVRKCRKKLSTFEQFAFYEGKKKLFLSFDDSPSPFLIILNNKIPNFISHFLSNFCSVFEFYCIAKFLFLLFFFFFFSLTWDFRICRTLKRILSYIQIYELEINLIWLVEVQ